MKHRLRRFALVLGLALGSLAQAPAPAESQNDVKLPNGKSQRDEILKAEHEQNLKDVAQIVELAQQLQQNLEKNDRFVLSLADLKKTEDIEKLAKKVRSRMQHN